MSESQKLGLVGALSISVGGMVGGGVYAVLGLVITTAGAASWLAFTGACLISMCAGYSYIKLNEIGDERGGSVTQIDQFTDRSTIAGMVGWTLLFGYIGAMALYAYAFGGFTVELLGVHTVAGLSLQPIVSVIAVGIFTGLNVLGTQATGWSEVALVVVKVAAIIVFGVWGLIYGFTGPGLDLGTSYIFDSQGSIIIAIALSFVSFQGWQLLIYDQESIENPSVNVPRGIYLSIIITIVLDAMIAIVTVNFAPIDQIVASPETAVATAVRPYMGSTGFLIVALSALLSTGSAINGTLFSSAHFAKQMVKERMLPEQLGDPDLPGAPPRIILVLGVLTAAFAALGTLEWITSFGSLSFMVVFGTMSYLAFQQRDNEEVSAIPPALGMIGSFGAFPILLYNLYSEQFGEFVIVVLIGLGIIAVEVLYFRRSEEHAVPVLEEVEPETPIAVTERSPGGYDSDYRIVVPIANPDHVEQLMETAVDLARDRHGEVLVLSVVDMAEQTPLATGNEYIEEGREVLNRAIALADDREPIGDGGVRADGAGEIDDAAAQGSTTGMDEASSGSAGEAAFELGEVPVSGTVRFAYQVEDAIFQTIDEYDSDAVLMGWGGWRSSRPQVVLGSIVDTVVTDADCDVLVERIDQTSSSVDSILLPTAGGPHADLAGEVVRAIARATGAHVELVRVVAPEAAEEDRADAEAVLEDSRDEFADIDIEATVVENDDVVEAIVDRSEHHDLTVLGATREGTFQRLVFGAIPEQVAESVESTVILTRRNLDVASRLQRLFGRS